MFFKRKEESPWTTNLKAFKKEYTNPVFQQNRILAQDVYLNMQREKTYRNSNVMLLATPIQANQFILSNILQLNSNWIIPDYCGQLLSQTKEFLQKNGYQIDIIDCKYEHTSVKYNPLQQFLSPTDIDWIALAHRIINPAPDDYLARDTEHILAAIMIHISELQEQQTSKTLKQYLLNALSHPETIEAVFADLDPHDVRHKLYVLWKCCCGKYQSASIEIALNHLQDYDDAINASYLPKISAKHAIFITYNDEDVMQRFWQCFAMQLIYNLHHISQQQENKKLPIPYTIISPWYIQNLEEYLCTGSKKNIQFILPYISITSIKQQTSKEWEVLIGNCDSFICAHCEGYATAEYVSYALGHVVVVHTKRYKIPKNTSICYQAPTKMLMEPDEIIEKPHDEHIVMVRAVKPIKAKPFDIKKHPNYNKLSSTILEDFKI